MWEDGVLYGRGASDMKGAIAAFVAAVARFGADGTGAGSGSISLLITGDEEGPAINGTRKVLDWLGAQGETLDVCLVGEPTNPDEVGEMVKIGRRGSLNGTLRVAGRQGHVAYPALADNPLPRLVILLDALLALELDQGTDHFQPSRLELTSIDVGNEATNVIPGAAAARFNVRFNDRHTGASLERTIRVCLDATGEAYEFATEVSGEAFVTPAGPAQHDHRRLRRRRDRHDANPQHHRRHLGRAFHQGPLPSRRVRPDRPDHAPHRRVRAGGGHRVPGRHLPRRPGALFRGDVSR